MPFAERIPLTPGSLVKIAKSFDSEASSVAVYADVDGQPFIWGAIDQHGWRTRFMRRETDEGIDSPGLLECAIVGVGALEVYKDYTLLGHCGRAPSGSASMTCSARTDRFGGSCSQPSTILSAACATPLALRYSTSASSKRRTREGNLRSTASETFPSTNSCNVSKRNCMVTFSARISQADPVRVPSANRLSKSSGVAMVAGKHPSDATHRFVEVADDALAKASFFVATREEELVKELHYIVERTRGLQVFLRDKS